MCYLQVKSLTPSFVVFGIDSPTSTLTDRKSTEKGLDGVHECALLVLEVLEDVVEA